MNDLPFALWEPVIGLEIHAQLNTRSKIFSPAPNHFGDEPNTNIACTCTGQPGSLPILNKEVVTKAVQFGLSIGAKIARYSSFDRKSYFYPDSPRNFQITQYETPLIQGGTVSANVEGVSKVFQVNRAHIEDDAAMLKHCTDFVGVDYNRAGTPLIEIVSEPCIHSPQDASAYAMSIRTILLYLDACDGNMDEGSFRIDVNVSVRLKGETLLRPRIEIKNINSFSFLEMSIHAEISRQIALYIANPDTPFIKLIPPSTYRWSAETKQNILMRVKEQADDYRYFPEPDLTPIILSEEYIEKIKNNLPELPQHRFNRYISDFGLSPYAASTLIQEKFLADYFEQANDICKSPRNLCNWITIEFVGRLKEKGKSFSEIGIPPLHIARLVQMIDQNRITGPIAKSIADEMIQSPSLDPEIIVQNNPDYQPINDASSIEPIVDRVIKENPQSIIDFQAGKDRAFAFLVGQVMKLTSGKASPAVVNHLLSKKINKKN